MFFFFFFLDFRAIFFGDRKFKNYFLNFLKYIDKNFEINVLGKSLLNI
jgi:hypothetical protein